MHSYRTLKEVHGSAVSQTIDSPITIFDFWQLSEAFAALLVMLVFGVVFYSWGIMALLLALVLIVGPLIRQKNERGIFLHWPYRYLRVSLPGIINPNRRHKFSD
jgi:hypothetical protein